MTVSAKMRNTNRNIWSRRLAFQAIYSWSINPCSIEDLLGLFSNDTNFGKSDSDYFNDIITGVINNIQHIDDSIQDKSDIDITKINIVELSIIRCYVYEIMYNKKFTYEVIISESVKLAKKFGGQDSYKFINAFLENYNKLEE